jgi:acetoin utilization deacetylase AcuC-like enzyme
MKAFYDERMVASSGGFSPSPEKPRELAERVRQRGLPLDICPVEPVTWDDFLLSHTPAYVEGIRSLIHANGFGTRSPTVRDALPYTTGALLCAARAALEEGCAWAFCSGFHHAGRSTAMGYCTFEDLTVTAKKLINEGRVGKVLILDGDAHWGTGCVECITSEWEEKIAYWHMGGEYHRYGSIKRDMLNAAPDLVLFQDGMDAYHLDPIGGNLTYRQLYERCQVVCEIAKANQIALAIDLAGGYKRHQETIEPVLVGHLNSIIASLKVFHDSQLPFEPDFGPFAWET